MYTYIMKGLALFQGNNPSGKNSVRCQTLKHKKYNKYYCGKIIDINKRMNEHKTDRRSNYVLYCTMNGDYEKRIKKFGVEQFLICMQSVKYTGG